MSTDTDSLDSLRNAPRNDEWADADEIDVRRYIGILARRWPEIALSTLAVLALTLGALFLYKSMTSRLYEAVASAAIVRTLTDVNLDQRFTTSSDQPGTMDANSRRTALVALVDSGSIAQEIVAKLGDQLTPEERNPSTLLTMVSGEMGTAGGRPGLSDLISIKAIADTPEKAALIANAWADAYVKQVNRIYGQVPDELFASVQVQLGQAQQQYQKAQAELEKFVATSDADALSRQVAETSTSLQALQDTKSKVLKTYLAEIVSSYERIMQTYLGAQTSNQILGFQKEQEGQRARISALFDAYNAAQVDSITAMSDSARAELRMYYDQWLRTTAGLATARALKEQLAKGGDGAVAGTALALQVLKLQQVTNAGQLPVTMRDLYQVGKLDTTAPAQTNLVAPTLEKSQPDTPQNVQTVQIVQPTSETSLALSPASGAVPALQLQLASGASMRNPADLNADIDGVIAAMQAQLSELEGNIARLSKSMGAGDGYQAIEANREHSSALLKLIQNQYPTLFQSPVISSATELAHTSSTIPAAGQQQTAAFLDLIQTNAIPAVTDAQAPLSQTTTLLDETLRKLKAQLEAATARGQQFRQQRDLTWEAYKALSGKQSELNLARAAGSSEVRLSDVAVPPDKPLQGISTILAALVAGVAGLLLGICIAFLLEYMGRAPLLGRREAAAK